MVNDLQELLHRNVAAPPPDHLDLETILEVGRRRVRRRRGARIACAAAMATAVAVAVASAGGPLGHDRAQPADTPPRPDAPTLRLSDARRAVEGRDYEVLTSHTSRDVITDDGQRFDGVTDDGQVLFRDGPLLFHDEPGAGRPRFALMDPATGEKDWLPDPPALDAQALPIALGLDQLVFLANNDAAERQTVYVFDRRDRTWRTMTWPTQPRRNVPGLPRPVVGPDNRVYFLTGGHHAEPPNAPGGRGGAYDVWSLSLTDETDVRDEHETAGLIAFTDSTMVWSEASMGDPGRIHVRDLATRKEHSFDPGAGARCDLTSLGASGDRIVLGESCGTYGDVQDQRVQVVSTDGDQVVTIQDPRGLNANGWLLDPSSELLSITVLGDLDNDGGTYVYDFATDRFLRFGADVARAGTADGPVPGRELIWNTPVNGFDGLTQRLVGLPG